MYLADTFLKYIYMMKPLDSFVKDKRNKLV